MDFSHLGLNLLEIPLSEIKMATNNFNEAYCIGTGGSGIVYKARLDVLDIQNLSSMEGNHKYVPPKINKVVAIKRIFKGAQEHQQGVEVFFTEVESLIRCKHHNIVSLLGFSREDGEHILVYEYAFNGSLVDYLEGNGNMLNLTWGQRIQICLDIAHGINYLHTNMEEKPRIIHRDIKSHNILLDENLKAKIADFGLSKVHPMKQQASTIYTRYIAGTEFYIDPEYLNTGKVKRESDIYSFGVVLFEVLSGSLAYNAIYMRENRMGLAPVARQRFNEGRIEELIDPKLTKNDNSTLNGGLVEDSFQVFSKIAYQCLAETQAQRPTMEVTIRELQNAFNLQAGYKLNEILSATYNFSDEKLITKGALGEVYEGQLLRNGTLMNFTVRRLDCTYGQGDELKREILMLKSLKHKNIISLLGHYDENNEKIIIYEQAFHGTLNRHLSDPSLTWSQRLYICLGVARALNHIHYDVIHCDINSSKIFLNKDWEPKIYGFEFSTEYPQSWRHRLLFSSYFDTKNLTPKYDVYSFGVLLLEVLCGRKPVITNDVVQEELDKIIDPHLRKQIDTASLRRFIDLAHKCLKQQLLQRPTMDRIIKELEEVLELHANPEHSKAVDEGTSSNFKMDFLEVPLSEIKRVTNDFDKTYSRGSGGFGQVYEAKLDVLDIQGLSISMEAKCKEELPKISATVAIKRITKGADEQSKQGFLAEIQLLSRCKHPNVVSLLGFSKEKDELILVYEYASKGSLGDYLKGKSKIVNLTWVQRLQICLDTANGINYLHTEMEGKPRIIHRDIKSDNILLDKNLNAKVGDFGLSKFHPVKQQTRAISANSVVGTETYVDPEYWNTYKYKKETDIYSFGVVLFEVLSGRLAWDFTSENRMGLAAIARRRFNEGTLKELIDPKLTEEDDEHMFTLNRGPNNNSFHTFSKIAYQCLAETQAKRPMMDVIIKKLKKALKLQGDSVVLMRFLPDDIVSATENFAEAYCIGLDKNGTVYKAELDHSGNDSSSATEGKSNHEPSKKRITLAIKHITSRKGEHKKHGFFEELEMRAYKHPNIVPLLGLCEKGDEMILVYEHASSRSLDDYLKSVGKMDSFTWAHRLRICLEIARGLNHLQAKMADQNIIRTDIRSANIMLDKNGEAKIGYFVISKLHPTDEEISMKVYEDPEYDITHTLETKSDIYSFGVVLFEIFCGRVAYDQVYIAENNKGLVPIAHQCFKDGTIKRIMDPKLKEDISTEPNQNSVDIFLEVAYQCSGESLKRPTMEMVIKELERALNFRDPQADVESR